MKLSEVASYLGVDLRGKDILVSQVCTDTRSIEPGALFVALKGAKFDGHDFVKQAIEKGAAALVSERIIENCSVSQVVVEDTTRAYGKIAQLHRQGFSGKIVGLTGSSGKTTVKGMISAMLKAIAPTHATEGNFNNYIGVPLTLLKLDNSFRYAVIEAGASGLGEIEYLTHLIQPDVSLVNNVVAAHVEGFGSEEAIAEEKSQIYKGNSHAVINLDEKYLPMFLGKSKGSLRTAFGFSKNPQEKLPENTRRYWHGHSIVSDEFGCASFSADEYVLEGDKLDTPKRRVKVSLEVLGEHNCRNALAAIACISALGVDVDSCIEQLAHYAGEKGRMQLNKTPGGLTVIDDTYNANPAAMKAAIDYLCHFPVCALVMGDMGELGEHATSMHAEIGEYAKSKGITTLIGIGPLSKAAVQQFGESAKHFGNKADIVHYIEESLSSDAVVLVKGSRSARMEEVVGALCKGCEVRAC